MGSVGAIKDPNKRQSIRLSPRPDKPKKDCWVSQ
jgi:hypothetical protein